MDTPLLKIIPHPWQKCILPDADQAEGRISLAVATLGVVDKHGDVIVAGSVGQQPVLISPMNHGIWQPGQVSVGHGTLYEADGMLKFDGQYNLHIPTGVENWSAVNDAPELHEVSFGFRVADYSFGEVDGVPCCFLREIKAWEVTPCVAGAGVGTGVLSIKSAAPPAVEQPVLPMGAVINAMLAVRRINKEFQNG